VSVSLLMVHRTTSVRRKQGFAGTPAGFQDRLPRGDRLALGRRCRHRPDAGPPHPRPTIRTCRCSAREWGALVVADRKPGISSSGKRPGCRLGSGCPGCFKL